MIPIAHEIKDSHIHGKGIFTTQFIHKTEIVMLFVNNIEIMTEKDFLEKSENDELMQNTGCRLLDNYFLNAKRSSGKMEHEDFINHSVTPNAIYHCGVVYANRNIKEGEEITIDYRYILSDKEQFVDAETGDIVKGYQGKIGFLYATMQLYNLFFISPKTEEIDDD